MWQKQNATGTAMGTRVKHVGARIDYRYTKRTVNTSHASHTQRMFGVYLDDIRKLVPGELSHWKRFTLKADTGIYWDDVQGTIPC